MGRRSGRHSLPLPLLRLLLGLGVTTGLFPHAAALAQPPAAHRNVVLVTVDGLRWQEVFAGADSALLANYVFTRDTTLRGRFWHPSADARGLALMPFLGASWPPQR